MLKANILAGYKKVGFVGKSILNEGTDTVLVLEKRGGGDTFTLLEYLNRMNTLVIIETGIWPDSAILKMKGRSLSERYVYVDKTGMHLDLPDDKVNTVVYMEYKTIFNGIKDTNKVIDRHQYVINNINAAGEEDTVDEEGVTEDDSIKLPTAAQSYDDGAESEMNAYIEAINRAVAIGKREVYLTNGVHWVPRKAHLDQLTAAGYDITIEKVGYGYHSIASWDSAKEDGGKIFYSEFMNGEKEEVSSDFFDDFR